MNARGLDRTGGAQPRPRARRRRRRVRSAAASASASSGRRPCSAASPTTSASAEPVRRDERRAARERFERGQPEAFLERRVRDDRRPPVQRGHDVVVDVAGADTMRVATPLAAIASRDRGRAPAVAAGEREAEVGVVARERRERGDERRDVLARFDACRRTRRTAA